MHCICFILPHDKQMKEINAETQTPSHCFSQACSLPEVWAQHMILPAFFQSHKPHSTAMILLHLKKLCSVDTFTFKEDLGIIKASWKNTAQSRLVVRFYLSASKHHGQRQKLSNSPSTSWGDSAVTLQQRTHHWMISVIWASQWATDSFLSARSLISSSSCRLFILSLSNMAVSWMRKWTTC